MLGNTQPRRFLTHERQLLETLLNQAATALDNARMFQLIDSELDERLRQLSALERVSQRMTAALNVPGVIEEVLKAALSVTYAETAACGLAEHPDQLTFTGRIRPARINGYPGVVLEDDDGVQTIAFEPGEDGRLAAIYIVRNPDKLRRVAF